MAGWDHDFEIDRRDTELLVDCLRILRRTCARHYVEMSYHCDATNVRGRDRYIIEYNLNSISLGIACGEFLTEMRAISVIQKGARRRRLPLRLVNVVAYSAVFTLEEQIAEGYATEMTPAVQTLLSDLQTTFWSWEVGVMPDADFLEAQHSFVINMALATVESATPRDKYPALVKKLVPDGQLRTELLKLGERRNRVKHRGKRDEAGFAARQGMDAVWKLSSDQTGFYPDPVPPSVREIVDDRAAVFKTPPMYFRGGRSRIVRR